MHRRITFLSLIAVVSIVSARTGRASSPPGGDRFAELFERTMAKRQTIRSIRARFTETTTSSMLEKPIVASGTVLAAPPMRVLMTYDDPERRIVAIDSRSLTVVWPDRREREKIDISVMQARIDRYFANASLDELRSMFDIVAAPDDAIPRTDRVEMRPKRKQIKEGLERLQLWINRDTLLLAQMEMTFAGGDRKTIKLDDVAVNVPVSDEMFRVSP